MPVLILVVPVNLHKLLQDGCSAARTANREAGRVMEVAKDLTVMLIVAVLGPEDCRTSGACKVLDVKFGTESGNVTPT